MVSEFSLYCDGILCHAAIASWMWPLAEQLVRVLYDDNVLIDKIWSSAVRGTEFVTMRALVFEDENDNLEAVAKFEYNKSKVSSPLEHPWELVDVAIGRPVAGLV